MKIVERSKFFMLISAAILLLGLASAIFMGGLNLGIDFTGGTIITLDMGGEFDTADVEKAFNDSGLPNTPVQKSATSGSQEKTLAEVRAKPMPTTDEDLELRNKVLAEIQKKYADANIISVEQVGAVASAELVRNALMSVAIAGVLILIYISVRFELYSGIAAVLALVHDVLIMFSFVCLIRLEINTSFIAAVLTIIGYSINNTIVVFDRVRDNQSQNPRMDMAEIVNKSIKETFRRSMYTSITTLTTIGCLYIFGTDAIRDFALPIIVGLLAGTYSSLVLAGPTWVVLSNRFQKNKTSGKGKAAKA